jgi:hypothetical protein
MMGHLWLKITVDTDVLKKKLIAAGWTVTGGRLSDHLKQLHEINKKGSSASMEERIRSEEYFKISKPDDRGVFNSAVIATEIILAMSSLYNLDFLLSESWFSGFGY